MLVREVWLKVPPREQLLADIEVLYAAHPEWGPMPESPAMYIYGQFRLTKPDGSIVELTPWREWHFETGEWRVFIWSGEVDAKGLGVRIGNIFYHGLWLELMGEDPETFTYNLPFGIHPTSWKPDVSLRAGVPWWAWVAGAAGVLGALVFWRRKK